MKKIIVVLMFAILYINCLAENDAVVSTVKLRMNTYMFSDPNPVPKLGRLYPYFRYDSFTDKMQPKNWKMIVLENDYIKVYICPEIGGKIWGAFEKSTGKEFIYFNHSVKFRDIAMRGPWTSGGMEFNFGDIGHIPTCATPVDYKTRKNEDGSVSCIVGAIDLPSGNRWSVTITLEKDKAYFTTKASMFNNTSLPATYYHWMNVAAKAEGKLEFLYPGNKWIGHSGEYGNWPIDKGIKISMYENNNFGPYKSYHIINSYSDFFGGYWHKDDFGFGHIADFDDKPGRKIWIWGLSDQGMIWKDLLTDSDGQYIEYQTGKLFNQAAKNSTFSPFKHREFLPYDSDIMNEYWFPLKQTGGMRAASEFAVLNLTKKKGKFELIISALQNINSNLTVLYDNKKIIFEKVKLKPLALFKRLIKYEKDKVLSVKLGEDLLNFTTKNNYTVNRPIKMSGIFNWNKTYGLYIKGLEAEKQRDYKGAMNYYDKCIELEPTYLPAISRKSLGYYRQSKYGKSKLSAEKALSIDTYEPLANYVYGLLGTVLSEKSMSISGFSIAAQSMKFRTASYTELAKLYFREKMYRRAERYANKALNYNINNINGLEILALSMRKQSKLNEEEKTLTRLNKIDPLNHLIDYEMFKLDIKDINEFKRHISNELAYETYLDLAIKYFNLNCIEEAKEILSIAPEHPIIILWISYLNKTKQNILLKKALAMPCELVFPHRAETEKVLDYFVKKNNNWKLKYYLGLIYWNKNLIKKAKNLFKLCNDEPDFFPFYLAKADLFKDNPLIRDESITKAVKIKPESWRTNLANIKLHMRNNDLNNAEIIARKLSNKYIENSLVTNIFAKILLMTGKYKEGIHYLMNRNILPYEGSTDSRKIYRKLCIRAAYSELVKKRYTEVLNYVELAKRWPKNLGSGKPYFVDERLEDFLIAYSYEKLGNKKKSNEFFKKIIDFDNSENKTENSKLLIQVISFKKFDRNEEALKIIMNNLKKEPNNPYLNWVREMYLGNMRKKKIILINDFLFKDDDFKLIEDLFDILK